MVFHLQLFFCSRNKNLISHKIAIQNHICIVLSAKLITNVIKSTILSGTVVSIVQAEYYVIF
jgi:hypothetical protein